MLVRLGRTAGAVAMMIVAFGIAEPHGARAQSPTAIAPSHPASTMPDAPAAALPVEPYAHTLSRWADQLGMRADQIDSATPGTFVPVGDGPVLKKGATGERAQRLVDRLVALGFLTQESRPEYFDDLVDVAVRSFQTSQGLRPDGLVGRGTLSALDRTPAEAAGIMRQTAASMRALRDEGLATMLLVNLPNQTVTLVRDGVHVITMRAVVGRPSRETPLLRDTVTHVIVNPTWTVPPTVLKQDKLPLLRRDGKPGISNATVYLDGEPVEPEFIDWSAVTPGRVRIVQQPGDHNALGRFRFNLTNPYNIYLHGTNEPRLFDREIRTISSGCVRLEDARQMAEILMAPQGMNAQRIDRLLDRGEPQWVKLAQPVPVRFLYWMATVDPAGDIRLHPDVYDMRDEAAPASAPAATRSSSGLSPA